MIADFAAKLGVDPKQAAGTLAQILPQVIDRLTPDGHAWLVVQRHLGADSLADWMTAQGWSTTRLCSRAGYRILEVAAR